MIKIKNRLIFKNYKIIKFEIKKIKKNKKEKIIIFKWKLKIKKLID